LSDPLAGARAYGGEQKASRGVTAAAMAAPTARTTEAANVFGGTAVGTGSPITAFSRLLSPSGRCSRAPAFPIVPRLGSFLFGLERLTDCRVFPCPPKGRLPSPRQIDSPSFTALRLGSFCCLDSCRLRRALMQGYSSILLVQRLNDLVCQLSELEDLRLKVQEAERRASAVRALQSPPSTQSQRRRAAGERTPEE
jgi:hypothetical protein